MKLDCCNEHGHSELPMNEKRQMACFAIRHDDGRIAKPEEIWAWVMDRDYPPWKRWRPINKDTPRDKEIIVYAPPQHGLPALVSFCKWHPDAGFCICELREPTHWIEKP